MFDKKFVHHFSVFLIWLFSISGILGILNEDYTDWFLSKTPLNLLLTFVILIVNIANLKPKIIVALSIPFFIGFVTEALGFNYGLIF